MMAPSGNLQHGVIAVQSTSAYGATGRAWITMQQKLEKFAGRQKQPDCRSAREDFQSNPPPAFFAVVFCRCTNRPQWRINRAGPRFDRPAQSAPSEGTLQHLNRFEDYERA